MKNKAMVTGLVLSVAAAVFAHAQQFNPESDFEFERTGNSVTITGYAGTSQTVNIPPRINQLPVIVIGKGAFSGANVTRVTIPDSVTTIGESAFWFCTGLTSVTIPNSVTVIGRRAFSECTDLTNVTIPDSVTVIGEGAFFGCDSLMSVTISDSVTTIGNGAFAYCKSLMSVTIPNSVTVIGEGAFSGCDSLTSVTIPNSVTTIGEGVYRTAAGWRDYASRIIAIR